MAIKVLDLTIRTWNTERTYFLGQYNQNQPATINFSQMNNTPLTIFISWLNLDLGVETCFFNGRTAYSKTWLQFVFPLYIWSIVVLTIILAKYSDRVANMMEYNTFPVLAGHPLPPLLLQLVSHYHKSTKLVDHNGINFTK